MRRRGRTERFEHFEFEVPKLVPCRRAYDQAAAVARNMDRQLFGKGTISSTESARAVAQRRLPRLVFDLVDGAAGTEFARTLNQTAIRGLPLRQSSISNADSLNIGVSILGQDFSVPFGIAPMGMCNLVDPNADRLLAEQAVRRKLPHCVSSASSSTLEDIRCWGGERAWFQLYVLGSMDLALEMIDRAEAAGYSTLVLTVDVPQVARRLRDLRNGFSMPFRIGPRQFLDFAMHPSWSIRTLRAGVPKPMNFETSRVSTEFSRHKGRGGVDFGFLDWLRNRWRGTLVVKGVLSGEDAIAIKEAGADAVWVSNHGGRQLDSAPAAIHALANVRSAVGPDYPLIFDSGVERGSDIVKALAVGADFVMVGRSCLFALGADGGRGLEAFFSSLEEGIRATLAQIGFASIGQVDGSVLAPISKVQAEQTR